MPRYNLNHQDIDTIIDGLQYLAMNASSTKEHSRITNLKNRLLSRLDTEDPNEIDVWSPFQTKG